MKDYFIQPIGIEDNAELKELAYSVLKEVKCFGPGLSSEDTALKNMYATYQKKGAEYWVIKDKNSGKILGAGGFSKLAGTRLSDRTCELQKVYFYPELRGKGMGRTFVECLIHRASMLGYQKIYLETLPSMRSALVLYQKLGFKLLSEPVGHTGHYSDYILYMLLDLQNCEKNNLLANVV